MRETRLYGSEGGGAARSPYPYPDARVAPKREQNSLFDVHNRLGVFGDRGAENVALWAAENKQLSST